MGLILSDQNGLTPAICQDDESGEVIMLGYVNSGALKRTLEGGEVWFYSRSRSDMWHKGEISGNYMRVRSVTKDCDGDTLLFKVTPDGPICHTGNPTCFFTEVLELPEFANSDKGSGVLDELFSLIQDRKEEQPEGSYTTRLLKAGRERIAQKVVEEAGEVAIAGAVGNQGQSIKELADLLYHSLVLLSALGAKPEDVWQELRSRRD